MAIVLPAVLFRPCLEEICITIDTDQNDLKWLLNLPESTRQVPRWRLRLFKFKIDLVHWAGIKNQATGGLLRLDVSDKDESPLENSILLNVIDSFINLPIVVHTVAQDEVRARRVTKTKLSSNKPRCDPPTTVATIRAWQQDTFYCTVATRVGLRNCWFTVKQKSFLVSKAQIDGAFQIMLPPSLRQRILTVPTTCHLQDTLGSVESTTPANKLSMTSYGRRRQLQHTQLHKLCL